MNSGADKNETELSLFMTNASDLLGKKSVRATFKLSAELIEAISIISSQLGIKQKSLFDHLMEDVDTLRTIAKQMESGKSAKKGRIQKTFVISKKSLTSLEAVSRKFAAPRDDIVEYSIKRLFPILATERQKQKKREAALVKVFEHFRQTEDLVADVKQLLGEDDQVYQALETVFTAYANTRDTVEEIVDKGKRVTAFPLERFNR